MWASCTRRCTLLRLRWVLRLAPWEAEIRTSLRRLPAQTTTPRLPWGSLSWVARPRESVKFRGERFAKTVRLACLDLESLPWRPLGLEGAAIEAHPPLL